MTATAEPDARTALPVGFAVRVRDDVLRADRGRVLIGGSPVRAVRLSRTAQEYLDEDLLAVEGHASGALARRLLDAGLADPVVWRGVVPPAEMTVVVPVRDRPEQLDRCLAALTPLHVLVVDDASTDPAAVAAVAERHCAQLLHLPRNVGPAAARNAGLAQVRTSLVAFVDSDVVVTPDALLDLARHCEDPSVALVAPRIAGEIRSPRPRWFERYDAAASSLDLGRTGGTVRPGAAVAYVPSACLVGRVDALEGGFDARMRVAEDVDFVWRLTAGGWAVRYDPTVVARHDVRSSIRGWLGRKFAYGTGAADLAIRHGDAVAPGALSLSMALAGAAVLQRRWWSAPAAALTVGVTARLLGDRLPIDHDSTSVATRLSVRALGWAVRQEAGLLLRHWWPLGMVGALVSRRVRRAVATAIAVDLACFLLDHPEVQPRDALVARRLDDLAYGSGLWWGALRRRHLGCLLVRRVRG